MSTVQWCLSQTQFRVRYIFIELLNTVTHSGRVTHITNPSLVQVMLGAWSTPSHFMDQCWHIVNSTIRIKLQWNYNRNSSFFVKLHLKMSPAKCVEWEINMRQASLYRWVDFTYNYYACTPILIHSTGDRWDYHFYVELIITQPKIFNV